MVHARLCRPDIMDGIRRELWSGGNPDLGDVVDEYRERRKREKIVGFNNVASHISELLVTRELMRISEGFESLRVLDMPDECDTENFVFVNEGGRCVVYQKDHLESKKQYTDLDLIFEIEGVPFLGEVKLAGEKTNSLYNSFFARSKKYRGRLDIGCVNDVLMPLREFFGKIDLGYALFTYPETIRTSPRRNESGKDLLTFLRGPGTILPFYASRSKYWADLKVAREKYAI